jgi:putative pyruvate formate lyase activating enzyme
MNQLEIPIPQIWNSNMYCSKETMKLLTSVIDVFLTDFKFGNNRCAKKLANIPNYFDIVSRNHIIASKIADVFIRHLILPEHISCCSKPVLTWIRNYIPDVLVNIMDQYHPTYQTQSIQDLQRLCKPDEIIKVRELARNLSINMIND